MNVESVYSVNGIQTQWAVFVKDQSPETAGFPPALEILEKWDNFFQSGKSQGILKKY